MVVNNSELKQRAAIFKALGHPTRLFIVEELGKTERCVCELTEMVGADISTVSRHLSVLRNAGIVNGEKRGLQVFYSLKTPCILDLFDCIRINTTQPVINFSPKKE